MSEGDVIVVDDFYQSPELIRNLALNQKKYLSVPSYSVAALQSLDAFYSRSMIERFQALVGSEIRFDQEEAAFGKFRLMYADATARLHIHRDAHPWAAIIYLTPDQFSRGGTGFYWHKATGLSGPPSHDHAPASVDRDRIEEAVVKDSLDIDKWELFHLVPFKFNRLVIFRGSKYFHGNYKRFGHDLESARLTQNFFFSTVNETLQAP